MKVKEFNRRVEYQGGADRQFNEWRIIDIHEIPRVFLERYEMDFYCCNGEKVFLLRLRNREEEKYCVSNDKESQKL